jgi:hypothetical protein
MRRIFSIRILGLFLVLGLLSGCSAAPSPVDELTAQLRNAPEYTIALEDMREEGTFFPAYYHKYKVLQGDQVWSTGWREVSEQFYRANENFLGMSLASKAGGAESTTPHPAGYNYVGNERYGQWQTDNRGNSFWEFYGRYALMRDVLGLAGGTIFRRDYDQYRGYQNQNRPYYGPTGREYGTNGTSTRQRNPSFFERRQAREVASQQRFRKKFQNRIGRSSGTSLRSRSFGFGK